MSSAQYEYGIECPLLDAMSIEQVKSSHTLGMLISTPALMTSPVDQKHLPAPLARWVPFGFNSIVLRYPGTLFGDQ